MDSRVRYAEIRPYTVPERLEELAGPAAGVVVLPTVLDWTPKRVYDLSDDVDLRMLYETVIREAMHVEELRQFLDPVLLSAVWQRLWLPRRAHGRCGKGDSRSWPAGLRSIHLHGSVSRPDSPVSVLEPSRDTASSWPAGTRFRRTGSWTAVG